ncbi:MAG: hypothetical protein M1833_005647 [Piccolia ochrophora]|nr:MAG: hypothetical protein M1833_005647 [Piccolia ochrophora]
MSLRDTVKALTTALSGPQSPYPLPKDLQDVIQSYLDKHEHIDDQDSQRLHDELLNLYQRYVVVEPSKHAAFLGALRELRPAITGPSRLSQWWHVVLQPTINSLGQEKAVISNIRGFILSVLIYEDDGDNYGENARVSTLFTRKLLEVYLEKTKLPQKDDESSALEYERSRFIANHLESMLIAFGRKLPKNLLTAIDSLLVKKESRSAGLNLLCTFVRYQPPHLYQVLETPLVDHLLKCLTIDTSSTAISLALLSLIMFLPHVPNSLAPYLPRLFVVYSRVLCWEKRGQNMSNGLPDGSRETPLMENTADIDPTWDVLHDNLDSSESPIPDLIHYFTFLYGLYPLNFLSYIRKPIKYLREAKFAGANDLRLDQAAIRSRSDQFRQVHLLHPNLYSMTIESELTDLNRFMKSEPSDVVAECMGLCVPASRSASHSGPPPDEKLPRIPESHLATEDIPPQTLLSTGEDVADAPSPTTRSNGIRKPRSVTNLSQNGDDHPDVPKPLRNASHRVRGSSSSRSNESHSHYNSPALPAVEDSPTLPAHLVHSQSDARLKDMLQTQETLRSGLRHVHRNGSVPSSAGTEAPSPRLDNKLSLSQDNAKSTAVGPETSDPHDGAAALQREVLLLRNELNFERYLKQQHLSHIGQLQGKHIREAAAEAETQNLINTNRALRVKVEEAKRAYALLRKEAATSKSHAKKWEGDMNSKTRALREDHKQWKAEEQVLRRELLEARQECEELRKVVVESESKELQSRQNLESVQINLDELEKLRMEVDRLNGRLRDYESREDEFEVAHQNEEIAHTQLETARLKLKSRDVEREKLKKFYDQRIADLESRLHTSQHAMSGQNPQAFQAMLDSALSASNMRFDHLKKIYNRLLNRYAELEIKYMDLQAADELGASPTTYSNGRSRTEDDFDFFGEEEARSEQRSRHHAASDPSFPQEELMGGTYGMATTEPINFTFPKGPKRLESLQGDRDYHPRGADTYADRRTPFEASLHSRKQHSLPDTVMTSSASMHSTRGSEHSGKDKPVKIQPKSEVRVYGRGGVQNIGKKPKDKEEKKEKKQNKAGMAIKSLRGFS